MGPSVGGVADSLRIPSLRHGSGRSRRFAAGPDSPGYLAVTPQRPGHTHHSSEIQPVSPKVSPQHRSVHLRPVTPPMQLARRRWSHGPVYVIASSPLRRTLRLRPISRRSRSGSARGETLRMPGANSGIDELPWHRHPCGCYRTRAPRIHLTHPAR